MVKSVPTTPSLFAPVSGCSQTSAWRDEVRYNGKVQVKKTEVKDKTKRKTKRNRKEENTALNKKQRMERRKACIAVASQSPIKVQDALGSNKYRDK